MASTPSESSIGCSKRPPPTRIGNGSTSGETPLTGSPSSQLRPKSVLETLAVAEL
jgi:hypothetical protein